jgi:uncharacterized membrane protein
MRKNNRDLIVAILIVGINIGWAQVPNRPLLINIILAVPLVVILPGYTLTQVLLRRRLSDSESVASNNLLPQSGLKSGRPVGGADQLVLSLGLSLVIDILMGFALNFLPIGLQASSWTLSLGLLTTLFALLAMLMRRKEHREVVNVPGIRIRPSDVILCGLAILIASSAVWFSVQRPLKPQPSFTQFWILPANQAHKSCAVSIGVQSFETASVTYSIVLTTNDGQTSTWSSIPLAPQSKWVHSVSITSGTTTSVFVEAQLYREDQPDVVYRNVHLTFQRTIQKNEQVQQQCVTGTA